VTKRLTHICLMAVLSTACGSGDAPQQTDTAAEAKAEKKKKKADGEGGGEASSNKKPKGPILLPGTKSDPDLPPIQLKASQCKDMTDGGDLKVSDCITDTIECGQTIVGHTRGGVALFDTKFYEKNFCTPATTNHDGGDERLYKFKFPEGPYRAKFILDSPCADLDISVLSVTNPDSCMTGKERNIYECDMRPQDGTKREEVEAVTDGLKGRLRDWLVVVEGKSNSKGEPEEEGAFSITVQCVNAVHW